MNLSSGLRQRRRPNVEHAACSVDGGRVDADFVLGEVENDIVYIDVLLNAHGFLLRIQFTLETAGRGGDGNALYHLSRDDGYRTPIRILDQEARQRVLVPAREVKKQALGRVLPEERNGSSGKAGTGILEATVSPPGRNENFCNKTFFQQIDL